MPNNCNQLNATLWDYGTMELWDGDGGGSLEYKGECGGGGEKNPLLRHLVTSGGSLIFQVGLKMREKYKKNKEMNMILYCAI